jgi:hypothetical protein
MAVDQIQQCNQKTLTKQPSKEFSVFKSVLLAHDYIKALIMNEAEYCRKNKLASV